MLFEYKASQFARHRQRFSPHDALENLSPKTVTAILADLKVSFRNRVFTPTVTLFALLSQVLGDDGSCRSAVMDVITMRKRGKKKACCLNSGSFSKAKARLPRELLRRLARGMGEQAAATLKIGTADPLPKWPGRVFVVDGTGVSLSDTPANREAYPRHVKKSGFPIARVVALFSLATGLIVDIAAGPSKGKGTGELTLLRQLWHNLQAGDTLLGDGLFSAYAVLAVALLRDCHVVAELPSRSHGRLDKRLVDQIITVKKPKTQPATLTTEEFKALPDDMKLRVVKITCAPNGFRPKTKYILTTHLDARLLAATDIAELYGVRWQAELHLRSIKTVLGMDILTSRTPEMALKEVWAYVLGYNLIRTAMLAAAEKRGRSPLLLSFRAAQQVLRANRQAAGVLTDEEVCDLIATQTVGERPGRFEPRALKRRKKNFALLSQSRAAAKRRLHKKSKDSPRA